MASPDINPTQTCNVFASIREKVVPTFTASASC